MSDVQNLKALAKAATPGPWVAGGNWVSTAKGGSVAGKGASIADCARGDQYFIAAANPATVLELIAENERLQSAAKTLSRLGYTDNGGELWKPPLGKKPDFDLIDQLRAEIERLQRFETAYKEFSDKTDWVRPNAASHELGMHVADILHKRCDDLTSHNQAQADEIVRLRKYGEEFASLAERRREQVEALTKTHVRYTWLRKKVDQPWNEFVAVTQNIRHDWIAVHDLDRAIDQMIEGEQP
jgi:hypothetical protein